MPYAYEATRASHREVLVLDQGLLSARRLKRQARTQLQSTGKYMLVHQALPALLSGKMVFIDEKVYYQLAWGTFLENLLIWFVSGVQAQVASSLLHQVVPSSRYGGKPKSRCGKSGPFVGL